MDYYTTTKIMLLRTINIWHGFFWNRIVHCKYIIFLPMYSWVAKWGTKTDSDSGDQGSQMALISLQSLRHYTYSLWEKQRRWKVLTGKIRAKCGNRMLVILTGKRIWNPRLSLAHSKFQASLGYLRPCWKKGKESINQKDKQRFNILPTWKSTFCVSPPSSHS